MTAIWTGTALVGRCRGLRRNSRAYDLKHLGDSAPVFTRDGQRITEAETIELGQPALHASTVDFVGHQQHGPTTPAQGPGKLLVESSDTGPRIDDEQHEI